MAKGTKKRGNDKYFIVKKFSKYMLIEQGSELSFKRSAIGYSVPAGYQFFSIAGFDTGHQGVLVSRIDMSVSSNAIQLFNPTENPLDGTFILYVTFIRSDIASQYVPPVVEP